MKKYKKIAYFLIITLIGCTMETKNRNKIEEILDYKFNYPVEATHYEYWKPKEELAYSYTVSRIKIPQERYNHLVDHLVTKNDFEHPKFKLNWTIPDEVDAAWWNPELETPSNAVYKSFENGWIQIKYEKKQVYILMTIN